MDDISLEKITNNGNGSRSQMILHFDTRLGMAQVTIRTGLGTEIDQLFIRDDLDMRSFLKSADLSAYNESEREYIRCVCAIVCRMAYDSKKPDFDKHKL